MIPRLSSTRPSVPELPAGQDSTVYQALTPFGQTWSLEKLVNRCCALGHKELLKGTPAQSEVWASVLSHLKRLKDAEVVNEEE